MHGLLCCIVINLDLSRSWLEWLRNNVFNSLFDTFQIYFLILKRLWVFFDWIIVTMDIPQILLLFRKSVINTARFLLRLLLTDFNIAELYVHLVFFVLRSGAAVDDVLHFRDYLLLLLILLIPTSSTITHDQHVAVSRPEYLINQLVLISLWIIFVLIHVGRMGVVAFRIINNNLLFLLLLLHNFWSIWFFFTSFKVLEIKILLLFPRPKLIILTV